MEELRSYETIGIEGFVKGPPHPLPLVYLLHGSTSNTEPFTSWEIVGDIKTHPEDFVVREVLPKDTKIPGLSNTHIEKIRIADISPSVPQQNFSREVDTKEKRICEEIEIDAATHPTPTTLSHNSNDAAPDQTSPIETIDAYLSKVARRSPYTVEAMREGIQNLNLYARRLMRSSPTTFAESIASKESTSEGDTEIAVKVWIPPLPELPTNKQLDSVALASTRKSERRAFHEAVRLHYPGLKTESRVRREPASEDQNIGKNKSKVNEDKTTFDDHWIVVTVDDTFNELAPYLLTPEDDLVSLLTFQNRGIEGAKKDKGRHTSVRNLPDDPSCSILKLRPGLSKEDRRYMHHSLVSKNKRFDTSTVQLSVPSCDVSTEPSQIVTALVVRWQRYAMMRGVAKRKRKRADDETENRSVECRYDNLLCVLQKVKTEHLTAMQKLMTSFRCPQSDIGFAGIKDLHAITYQFITLRGITQKRAEKVATRLQEDQRIVLSLFYKVDFMLRMGMLESNQFDITIRNLRRVFVDNSPSKESLVECDWEHIQAMFERVKQHGFVNFYGEQRVGASGPASVVGVRAFDVGKAMLQKDYMKAIHLLMEGSKVRVSDDVRRVRQTWKESDGDPVATLKAFPASEILSREKVVLRGLNRFPDNPLEALRFLSHSMRMFYVNAYQSYVWNLAASQRIKRYGDQVVLGDLYFDTQTEDRENVKVVQTAEELNTVAISQVALPLPGYNVEYPANDIGQLYREILQNHLVSFDKTADPEATAKGSYRKLVVVPWSMRIAKHANEKDCAQVSFRLPKGCYATMLLRELMVTTTSR